MSCQQKKGFTLIELLVVIAIIGLIASIAIVSVNRARSKARDVRRLTDIKQIQKALELYYDKNGVYPTSGNCGSTIPNSGWCNSVEGLSSGRWLRNGTTVNLSEFLINEPVDPKPASSANWLPSGGGSYYYFASGYGGSGKWYMIIFGLEDTSHLIQTQDGVTACDGTYFHYGNGSNGIVTLGTNSCR